MTNGGFRVLSFLSSVRRPDWEAGAVSPRRRSRSNPTTGASPPTVAPLRVVDDPKMESEVDASRSDEEDYVVNIPVRDRETVVRALADYLLKVLDEKEAEGKEP